MYLLKNQIVDTDGSQEVKECSGGSLLIQAEGDFGGGTITIQGKMQGFDFQDLRDEVGDVVSITEATTLVVGFCKPGLFIRASLVGATAADVSVGML